VNAAARLDRLEDVIVLLSQQELTPKAGEDAGVIPAADVPSDEEGEATSAAPADTLPAANGAAKAPASPTVSPAGHNQ
jgi:hypothetical protein